jgi:hypothetical protein
MAACVTYEPASSPEGSKDASSGASSSSSSSGSSGMGLQVDAGRVDGGSAADGATVPGECNALTQLGQPVPLALGAGNAPAATGGTASGTYVLVASKVYAPLLPISKMFPASTIKMTGLAFEMLRGDNSTNSGTLTVANAALTFNATCGAGNDFTGSTFTYTATALGLKLYTPLVVPGVGTFTMEFEFSKR